MNTSAVITGLAQIKLSPEEWLVRAEVADYSNAEELRRLLVLAPDDGDEPVQDQACFLAGIEHALTADAPVKLPPEVGVSRARQAFRQGVETGNLFREVQPEELAFA